MHVHVVFLGRASEIIGRYFTILRLKENATLDDLIREIGRRINERFYKRYIDGHFVFIALVNNKPVIDPRYTLKDGDRVVFITPEMGG